MKLRLPARAGAPRSASLSDPSELAERFPSPEEVVETCLATALSGPQPDLLALAGRIGAPATDLTVTPMSGRAAFLGLRAGAAFFHHELRVRLPMPPDLEPEVAVWGAGTVPEWQSGILEEPKYFSFFQDGPFAAYNPNYVSRWRAHELLHAAQGFYWNPQMTRFEFYVGARVNELLPVVHWYGFDEMFRREGPSNGHRNPSWTSTSWWELPDSWWEEGRATATGHARRARKHLTDEWQAVLQEIESGDRHETPRGRLNASSDAVGYLRGHWNRCTAWSFGAWVERFLSPEVDYADSLETYAQRVANTALALVDDDLAVNNATWERRRARRVLQDVAYRAFLALEWLDEGGAAAREAERTLMPVLDAAAVVNRDLLTGTAEIEAVGPLITRLFEAFDAVHHNFPASVERGFKGLGYAWPDVERTTGRPRSVWVMAARHQLTSGMQSCCPESWRMLGGMAKSTAMMFAESDAFEQPGRLADRFVNWASSVAEEDEHEAHGALSGPVLERLSFEAWAGAGPRQDEEADLFGAVPDGTDELAHRGGVLRLHHTVRRGSFDGDLVAELVGPEPDRTDLIGVVRGDELRVMLADAQSSGLMD